MLQLVSGPRWIGVGVLLSLTLGWLLFLLRYLDPGRLLPFYARLSPLLWYLLALSLQVALFLLVRQQGFRPEVLRANKSIYVSALVTFAILIGVLLFVALTKLGITKDAVYWGEPGVPIPAWLFVGAMLLGGGLLYFESWLARTMPLPILEILIPLFIWVVAVTLWLSVPLSTLKNSFYAPITAPYSTPFPYSDAAYYDYLAQSLLVGADYLGNIPPRPLYVTFLAFLHLLFGQDYVLIIAAQTMFLALFPVALYWLGSRLHSPAAGIVIAFFAIFRELASLWISSDTRTSVTKMFLTDFPTALGLVLVCLAVMTWLERRDTRSILIAGGAFGLLLLLRTQSLLILPLLVLLTWFVYRGRVGDWLRAWVIFLAMLALTILPWMVRNYFAAGTFALDYTSPTSVIYAQLSAEDGQPDFTADDGTRSSLFDLVLNNPGALAGYVTNHFLNTQIGGLLALPLIAPFDGLRAPINLYWMEWDGRLPWYNLLLIIFYLAVIALGIGAAWQRLKWIGLTPLVFNLGYALSNGIARFSSWRYNLPVDWVAYFYFGIGMIELLIQLTRLFGANRPISFSNPMAVRSKEKSQPAQLLFVSAFILVGALPWLAEGLVSPRYADQTSSTLTQQVLAVSNAPPQNDIETFASRSGSFFEMGRLLYPRFFTREKGIASANPWPAYRTQAYPRFGFMLMNQEIISAILPARDSTLTFPHGADAIVLGCMHEDYVEVRLVAFPELDSLHTSAPLSEPCSP